MMNGRTIALVAAVLVTLAAPAHSQTDEDPHAGHQPAEAAQEKGTVNPLAAGFERMRTLIAQAQAEQDPAARRQLLGEHVQAMRDQVRAMRAGGKLSAHDHTQADTHDSAQAGDKQGKGMMHKSGMMKGKGGMMGMHRRVEQRLDAIEQMLEQLVEREALEQ